MVSKNYSKKFLLIIVILIFCSVVYSALYGGVGTWKAFQNDGSNMQSYGVGGNMSLSNTTAIYYNESIGRKTKIIDYNEDGYNEIILLSNQSLIYYSHTGNYEGKKTLYSSGNVSCTDGWWACLLQDILYPNATYIKYPMDSDFSVNQYNDSGVIFTYVSFLMYTQYSNYKLSSTVTPATVILNLNELVEKSPTVSPILRNVTSASMGSNCIIDGTTILCPMLTNCSTTDCYNNNIVGFSTLTNDYISADWISPGTRLNESGITNFTYGNPHYYINGYTYQGGYHDGWLATNRMDYSPIRIDFNNDGVEDWIFTYKNLTNSSATRYGYQVISGSNLQQLRLYEYSDTYTLDSIIAKKLNSTGTTICLNLHSGNTAKIVCNDESNNNIFTKSRTTSSYTYTPFGITFANFNGTNAVCSIYLGDYGHYGMSTACYTIPSMTEIYYNLYNPYTINFIPGEFISGNFNNDTCTDLMIGTMLLYTTACNSSSVTYNSAPLYLSDYLTNAPDCCGSTGTWSESMLDQRVFFADLNNDGIQDVLRTGKNESTSNEWNINFQIGSTDGAFLDRKNNNITLGYNVTSNITNKTINYSGYFGYYLYPYVNSTNSYQARECNNLTDLGVNKTCNYFNSEVNNSERLVTNCGDDNRSFIYGNWSTNNPYVNCTYNTTGIYHPIIYIQSNASTYTYGNYNLDDIVINVTVRGENVSNSTPGDGYVQNSTYTNNFVPVMVSATTTPTNATSADTLSFTCYATDGDNNNLMYYYNIYRNNTLYTSGSTWFSSSHTPRVVYTKANPNRGDSWKVDCYASDGLYDSTNLTSDSVTIQNAIPTVNVGIIRQDGYPFGIQYFEDAKIITSCNDADSGDVCNVSTEYKWAVNGNILVGKTDYNLSHANYYRAGDNVTGFARVSDGINWSDWGNSTRQITDYVNPALTNVSVSNNNISVNTSIVFSANCYDAGSGVSYVRAVIIPPSVNSVDYNLTDLGSNNYELIYKATEVGNYDYSIYCYDKTAFYPFYGFNYTTGNFTTYAGNFSNITNTSAPEISNIIINPLNQEIYKSTIINADCTAGYGVSLMYANITNPSNVTYKYVMSYLAGNSYEKNYYDTEIGNYSLMVFCEDNIGNYTNSSSYIFQVKNVTETPGGGGGGGGIVEKNITISVNPNLQKLYLSAGETKNNIEYRVTNNGIDNVSVIMSMGAGDQYVNWVSFEDGTQISTITLDGNKPSQLSAPIKYIRYKVNVPTGTPNGEYYGLINLVTDAGTLKYNIDITVSDSRWLFLDEFANNKLWERNQTICMDAVPVKVNATCQKIEYKYYSISVLDVIIGLIILIILATLIYFMRK